MNKLEIRQLKFNDVYKAAKILKTVEIDIDKEKLKADDEDMNAIKIMLNAIGNLESSQHAINNFLGSLFGISGEEFGDLDFDISFDCMEQFKNLKGIDRFFNSVKNLII